MKKKIITLMISVTLLHVSSTEAMNPGRPAFFGPHPAFAMAVHVDLRTPEQILAEKLKADRNRARERYRALRDKQSTPNAHNNKPNAKKNLTAMLQALSEED